MKNGNTNSRRKIRNLVLVMTLTAIIVSVSTYAWFVGLRTVDVSPFDVEVLGTESLMLSVDGATFQETVTINSENYNDPAVVYTDNTNSWSGLLPVSTVGEVEPTTSRLKLYEKSSLTPSKGGFRLMSSSIKNELELTSPEPEGYVAFDLFVHNFSGRDYIEALNPLDEEGIFLTIDSEVNVAASGTANTGIENSVRVAFAQIGRVKANPDYSSNQATVTSMNCAGDELTNVTGICRTAQIWEPNDRSHVESAINYYDANCRQRTAAELNLEASFGLANSCNQVVDGIAYPTYAISQPITSADQTDVYDGEAYNTYTASSKLVPFQTFTDTDKLLDGVERPEFMTLAPNSITKIRVYIYIEGQDVDNYDFAQIGKTISVKFGFTKQRFVEDDIDYNGPDLNAGEGPLGADRTPPVITLEGDSPMTLTVGSEYVEPGATANDTKDGEVTADIEISGTVNTNVAGEYLKVYKVQDLAGNIGIKTRTIIVQ